MSVRFLTSQLRPWDEAKADALAVTFFADERPLRGAAGLADWRLCGRVSRLIRDGRLSGDVDDILLMPTGNRLVFKRLFVIGLGESKNFSEDRYRDCVRRVRTILSKAGMRDYAVQPPGRATGLIAARRALSIWIDEANSDPYEADVAIVDTPGAQKEMADILHTHRR